MQRELAVLKHFENTSLMMVFKHEENTSLMLVCTACTNLQIRPIDRIKERVAAYVGRTTTQAAKPAKESRNQTSVKKLPRKRVETMRKCERA